ncbi:entericidin A/B family lipoprotein [Gluconobacter morbifer]|uniref:Entericidin EcnAB n=1 Tax=Gluconobacter morbifer G707 TaxID=1088869 RepID=G6XJI6_9PROT|nr:entericidin A/B family lipoprotein [Gluconobacter morbifer]EHH68091.1 entericidin EcnAB [Gluconobacter morbifer G707]
MIRTSIARLALSLVLLSGAAVTLSACNTMRGAGQDVSSVGHNVSRGANATQGAITRSTSASPN